MTDELKTNARKKIDEKLRSIWNFLGVWIIVLIIVALLSLLTDRFMTMGNIINVVRQISVNAIVSLGAAFVIFGGEIDLSSGAVAAFSGVVCAKLMAENQMSIGLAILISILLGALIGLFNGMIVTLLKIDSFIVTLGMSYVLLGITLLLTNSEPISGLPESFMFLGRGYLGTLPVPMIITLVLFICGAFIMKFTIFGRSVIAVGENKTAAKLSGINVTIIKIWMFIAIGVLSAVAGVVLTSRLSSGQPTAGSDISLQAIAAVFVGGTSQGNVVNTLAGALVLGLVNNGLNLLQVNAYWQKIALGFIIVMAVVLDTLRASRMAKKKST